MKKIVIDTIGDMVFRGWKSMESEHKCPHCKNKINIVLKFNRISFKNIKKVLKMDMIDPFGF